MSEESLWTDLLKQSTNRGTSNEAFVVLVGDIETNKRTILSYLCGSTTGANQTYDEIFFSLVENINYDYFEIEDPAAELSIKVNIWSLDQRLFQSFPDIVKIRSSGQRLLFLLALDLNLGEEFLSSFKRWIKFLSQFIPTFLSTHTAEQKQSLKESWYHYITTARINKGNKLSMDKIQPIEGQKDPLFEEAMQQLPFPLIVLGYNHTFVTSVMSSSSANLSNEVQLLNKFKENVGRLRYYCLHLGAAVFFSPSLQEINCSHPPPPQQQSSSSSAGTNSSSSNQKTNKPENFFRKYLLHRLYPEQIAMELSIEEKLEKLFIPSGFDALEMIQISSNVKYSEKEFRLSSWLPQEEIESTTASSSVSNNNNTSSLPAMVDVDNEQDWLQGLHSFIAGESSSGKYGSANLSDMLAENPENPDESHASSSISSGPAAANAASSLRSTRRSTMTSNLSSNNLPATASSQTTKSASPSILPADLPAAQGNTTTSAANPPAQAAGVATRSSARRISSMRTAGTSSASSAANTQDFFKSLLEKK